MKFKSAKIVRFSSKRQVPFFIITIQADMVKDNVTDNEEGQFSISCFLNYYTFNLAVKATTTPVKIAATTTTTPVKIATTTTTSPVCTNTAIFILSGIINYVNKVPSNLECRSCECHIDFHLFLT